MKVVFLFLVLYKIYWKLKRIFVYNTLKYITLFYELSNNGLTGVSKFLFILYLLLFANSYLKRHKNLLELSILVANF